MTGSTERVGRRARGDEGAALVEFAFVAVLLFSMVFGIIHYGLILSFKQDVTRAAAEGARAGAVEFPADETTVETAAFAAADEAAKAFGGTNWETNGCNRTGMSCVAESEACDGNPLNTTGPQCVTMTITFDYGNNPIYGEIPLIGGLVEPETITAKSVARTNE